MTIHLVLDVTPDEWGAIVGCTLCLLAAASLTFWAFVAAWRRA